MVRFYSLFIKIPSRYLLTALFFALFLLSNNVFAQPAGNPGSALSFSGSYQYVEVLNNSSLNLGSYYTIEAWIKPHELSFLSGIVSKYHVGGANGYTLRLRGSEPYSGINFNGAETDSGVITIDQWSHVAAVSNNGTLHVYVNGIEQALYGVPDGVNANDNDVAIGADYLDGGRYFNGMIDEVRIWNIARTQAEVQSDLSTSLTGSDSGLVAYWRLDEGTGNSTADLTSNSNNGTLINGPSWTTSTAPFPATYFSVSPSALNFGLVAPGTSKTDTLTVTNLGGDTLHIYDVTSSSSEFSVTATTADLTNNQSQQYAVTFTPDSNGSKQGTLTFIHSGHDSNSIVNLSGVCGIPPHISVAPDSISVSLLSGDSTSKTLNIKNTGGSDLNFAVSLNSFSYVPSTKQPLQIGMNKGLGHKKHWDKSSSRAVSQHRNSDGNTSSQRKLAPAGFHATTPRHTTSSSVLPFVRILTYDISDEGAEMLDSLGVNFTNVTYTNIETINPNDFDVLLVGSDAFLDPLFYYTGGIADYISHGGGLVCFSQESYDWLPGSISVNDEYGDHVSIIAPSHPVMYGLTDSGLSNWDRSYHTMFINYDSTFTPLEVSLDLASTPITLAGVYGEGRIVVTSHDPENHFTNENALMAMNLAVNMINWAARPHFSLSTYGGVIPAGDSTSLTVGIHTNGLGGGDYHGNISITSNDSSNLEVVIPLSLHITAFANIELSDSVLDFGTKAIWEREYRKATIYNEGTGLLVVNGISSDMSDFSVDSTSFIILPGSRKIITITYSSLDTGWKSGTITINCNDPVNSVKTISVQGTSKASLSAGTGLYFDGNDQYVAIQDNDALDLTSSYTIEAWIKPSVFTALGGIISKYQEGGANGYTLRLSGTNPFTGINFDGLETATGILKADTWYHIAAVNDSGERHLYVNGIEQSLTGTAGTIEANDNILTIGVDYLEGARFFKGSIDEVRIWNAALRVQHIREFMKLRMRGGEDNLIGYWRLDEGNNLFAMDTSPNCNTGTLLGLPMWLRSSFPLGTGESSVVLNITNGGLKGAGMLLELVEPFDNPVDLYVTYLSVPADSLPTTSATIFNSHYWTVDVYGDPGTFNARMYMVVDTAFTRNGSGNKSLYTLYKREGNSDSLNWTSIEGADTVGSEVVVFTGISSFSQFVVGTDAVQNVISSFTGNVLNNRNVKLDWHTISETNNLGFYVERHSQNTSVFETVSPLISGAGTSAEGHDYTFTDSTATAGTNIYRIKQMSSSGDSSYSSEITVSGVTAVIEEGIPSTFNLFQNYPNPFNPSTSVKFEIPEQSQVTLKVVDVLGKEVATLVNETKERGFYTVHWNASNIPSGVYFYRLTATPSSLSEKPFTTMRKMLLLR